MDVRMLAQSWMEYNIIFAAKKEGSFQRFIHYREKCSVNVRYGYPVLQMDKCLDLFGRLRLFQTLEGIS